MVRKHRLAERSRSLPIAQQHFPMAIIFIFMQKKNDRPDTEWPSVLLGHKTNCGDDQMFGYSLFLI